MGRIQEGKPAPDFTLPASGGGEVSLADFRGKKTVILYFYPKDNTPGCTQEACDFRDAAKLLEKADCEILGVSPDGAASHEKFLSKFGLPFLLLSDEEKKVLKLYGVWQKKSLYRKVMPRGLPRGYLAVLSSRRWRDERGEYRHKTAGSNSHRKFQRNIASSFDGKEFMGVVRTTLVIDRQGMIRKIYPKVKVEGHVREVLDFVKSL